MSESERILDRLLSLHPKKIDLSLGRLEALLARMGHPHRALPPVIHVAGTNGKGSTIAFLRAMLEAAGKRVHVYISPHLVRYHERYRLAGQLVSEDQLVDALNDVVRINDGEPITVFEVLTAVGFKLFHDVPADVLLLEVGLGGRFDATNVIDKPALSVITPVSIDHVEFLGDTISKIAFEKAGIIKQGVQVIVGDQLADAREVIETVARQRKAPALFAGQDFQAREERGRLIFEDECGLLDLPMPRLTGPHQISNAATAIAALRAFAPDSDPAFIEEGLRKADWPARMQHLSTGALLSLLPDGTELWLDGGHNAAGGEALAAAMRDLARRSPRPLIMICGTLTTKDTRGFLAPFKGLVQELIAVPIPGEHAGRAPQEVMEAAQSVGLVARQAASFEAALKFIAQQPSAQPMRVLIGGSLYLAGQVLAANGTLPD
jgi:dihydrofolate synthase/folylpolyglutamate synthase